MVLIDARHFSRGGAISHRLQQNASGTVDISVNLNSITGEPFLSTYVHHLPCETVGLARIRLVAPYQYHPTFLAFLFQALTELIESETLHGLHHLLVDLPTSFPDHIARVECRKQYYLEPHCQVICRFPMQFVCQVVQLQPQPPYPAVQPAFLQPVLARVLHGCQFRYLVVQPEYLLKRTLTDFSEMPLL